MAGGASPILNALVHRHLAFLPAAVIIETLTMWARRVEVFGMPIYEYQCQSCGNELEVMQRITEDPLDLCPSCGGKLQRLISNTGFILKGTGWYVTDYARKGSSSSHEEKGSTSKVDAGASGSSSTSKDD
jgi:putative FmdB family regulatory protein